MSGSKKISVVIPTFNSLKRLDVIFRSIIKQNNINFKFFEFIVVQNNEKYFNEIHPHFLKNKTIRVKIIKEKKIGLHYARNSGVKKSSTDNIILIDDDVSLSKNYLNNMQKSLKKYKLVGGPNLMKTEIKIPNWIKKNFIIRINNNESYCKYLSYLDFGKKNRVINPMYIFGMNMGFKKKIYYDLRGFNPDLVGLDYNSNFIGDGESGFLQKCFKKGIISFYNSSCKVYHMISSSRLTLLYFKKRAVYHGKGDSFSKLRDNPNFLSAVVTTIKFAIKSLITGCKIIFYSSKKKKDIDFHYKLQIKYEYLKSYLEHHLMYILNLKVRNWINQKDYL